MFKPFIIIALICSAALADKNNTNQQATNSATNKTSETNINPELKQFPIISDDTVFLPDANRYIFATNKLLNNNNQYEPGAGKILASIVPLAKKARIVNIYGFTNEALQGPIGVKISTEQAQRIADYLWSQGIELDKMNIRGMGYQEPRISSSNDVEQHFFNQRIEIDLIP